MIAPYSNVRDARFELRERSVDSSIQPQQGYNNDDVELYSYLRLPTARLTSQIGSRFVPIFETKTYSDRDDKNTGRSWRIDMRTGRVYPPEPLMAVPTLVTDGDGNALTYGTDFVEDPPGQYPAICFRLTASIPCVWFNCKTWWATYNWQPGQPSVMQITGIWGWHMDYNNAYVDTTDTVQDNPLTINSKTIHVVDVDGVDELGRSPRFTPGQLIKIEDELCLVNTTDKTLDTIGVTRGQNGTTAASHIKTTAITVFEPDDRIQQACRRWAAFDYKRRGHFSSSEFDSVAGVSMRYPTDAPTTVYGAIDELVTDIWGGEAI